MAKSGLFKVALVVTLLLAASSSVSYASTYAGATNIGGTTTGISFSASNNSVVFGISNGSSSTTYDGTTYSIRAKSTKGDKVIAGASGDAKIYFQVTTVADTTLRNAAATTDNYSSSTVWTSM